MKKHYDKCSVIQIFILLEFQNLLKNGDNNYIE